LPSRRASCSRAFFSASVPGNLCTISS
jgi:hypothetical protein